MRGMARLCALWCLALAFIGAPAAEVAAQPLGTFRWQLQPYCNHVTVNITGQAGSVFALDGFDDQCGDAQRASVVGTAFLNPDGTVGIGLNTVLSPGGASVHVEARVSLATLAGPWRDSAGNSGTFVFTPLGGSGGTPRPVAPNGLPPGSVTALQLAPGNVGAAQINLQEVQARVSGSCLPQQAIRSIGANGSVLCGSVVPLVYERDISAMTWQNHTTYSSLTIQAPNVLTSQALANNIVLVYVYTSDFGGDWGIVPYHTERDIRLTAQVNAGSVSLSKDQDGSPSTQSWHTKLRVVLIPIIAGGLLQ